MKTDIKNTRVDIMQFFSFLCIRPGRSLLLAHFSIHELLLTFRVDFPEAFRLGTDAGVQVVIPDNLFGVA
jgi:hypothetical protein